MCMIFHFFDFGGIRVQLQQKLKYFSRIFENWFFMFYWCKKSGDFLQMMTSLQKQFLELHLTFLHSCRVCQRHVLLLLLKKRPQREREKLAKEEMLFTICTHLTICMLFCLLFMHYKSTPQFSMPFKILKISFWEEMKNKIFEDFRLENESLLKRNNYYISLKRLTWTFKIIKEYK